MFLADLHRDRVLAVRGPDHAELQRGAAAMDDGQGYKMKVSYSSKIRWKDDHLPPLAVPGTSRVLVGTRVT